MSVFLPESVRQDIWAYVYAEADKVHYLDAGRTEHVRLLAILSRDPQAGGRLREYMPTDKVASYIRHSILNQYAKDRRPLPPSVDDVLAAVYGEQSCQIDYNAVKGVSVHRLASGAYIAASRTIANSWASALRKLLLYVAAAPGLPPQDGRRFELALIIYQHGSPLNSADRRLVEEGLRLVGIRCIWP